MVAGLLLMTGADAQVDTARMVGQLLLGLVLCLGGLGVRMWGVKR